jgi:hypothetical protein
MSRVTSEATIGSAAYRSVSHSIAATFLLPAARRPTRSTVVRRKGPATANGWVAYLRLEDPPGLSPITTVGRYNTIEAAQVATDEVWASR